MARGSSLGTHHGSPDSWSGGMFCRSSSPRFLAVYKDKLLTSEVFLSQCSEVSKMAMLLFGGTVTKAVDADQVNLTMHKGFLKFTSSQDSAHIVIAVRSGVERLLAAKLNSPEVDAAHAAAPLIDAVLALLRWEERDGDGRKEDSCPPVRRGRQGRDSFAGKRSSLGGSHVHARGGMRG
jgi:hypothetical protein